MKSIADLEKIRQKTLSAVILRRESEGSRILVGIATCGIAAWPETERSTPSFGRGQMIVRLDNGTLVGGTESRTDSNIACF